jgi:uncharacterized protein (UPF0335 family)
LRTQPTEKTSRFDGTINAESLARYVDRIERLHTQRDQLSYSVKLVYDEAKSAGFVTAILRQVVRERRMESDERHDHYELLDTYRAALGMLAGTPLGDAALERAGARPAQNGQADAPGAAAAPKPRPFAEQTVAPPRPRGRPRKGSDSAAGSRVDDALAAGRRDLNGEPAGRA